MIILWKQSETHGDSDRSITKYLQDCLNTGVRHLGVNNNYIWGYDTVTGGRGEEDGRLPVQYPGCLGQSGLTPVQRLSQDCCSDWRGRGEARPTTEADPD